MRASLHRATAGFSFALIVLGIAVQAEDLKISKKISVAGNSFTSDTYVKGARERNVMSMPGGASNVTIHQCDLKRTLNLNEQTQSYLVMPDPDSEDVNDAAALLTGAPSAQPTGGKITLTSTIADTGERKQMFGFAARHLKTTVVAESSANACSAVHEKFDIDGWYADIGKETAGCSRLTPPIRQGQNCQDRVVIRSSGKGKLGFPLAENLTIQNGGAQPVSMNIDVAGIARQTLSADLFDAPAGYKQVNSFAELYGVPQPAQAGAGAGAAAPLPQSMTGNAPNLSAGANPYSMMTPAALAQASAMAHQGVNGMGSMPGAAPAGGAAVAAPQALGPKAPGKIRIGVVSPDAQMGQGSSSGMEYGTPIRNAIIQYMNGPAVEVAALDSHIQMQLQAEAQQKQCDYVLFSNVVVKHGSGGGFGKFMKMASPAASVMPMAAAGRGLGAAAATSAVSSTVAQTAAMTSLANFNGQIKSKDEVSLAYQLVPAGQQAAKLSDTLKAKASSDGQDVLSPLIEQLANTVLTAATKN
ncbi:MAG TPA: hypothetical protein VFA89_15295 [Terriglobales bacterium]|nr:hypothetical protein [Terriglobales bacterium]